MLDNRLSTLTNAHNYLGDLHIERNATIGGNLDVSGDLHARSYYATGNYYLNNYVLIPAGTIIQSAAINEPAGWLDCNGRTLLVTEYAYLFSAIGYGYGGADLSFNIPDMRGRVGVGYGDGPNTDTYLTPRNLGAKGGAETHTLVVSEMPAHDHGGTTGITTGANNGSTVTASLPGHDVADDGSHSHTIPSQGGNGAHNNMQPFLVIRYLIKY
jgi:microcystin-dependent protein